MYCMWPEKFVALAQIMCSSTLLPFLIDLIQQMEMWAVFGFDPFPRDYFWNALRGHEASLQELHHFRQTVSSNNLGNVIIDVSLLSEELKKRVNYCKMVWGMNLPQNSCENWGHLLRDEEIDRVINIEYKVSFHHLENTWIVHAWIETFLSNIEHHESVEVA